MMHLTMLAAFIVSFEMTMLHNHGLQQEFDTLKRATPNLQDVR